MPAVATPTDATVASPSPKPSKKTPREEMAARREMAKKQKAQAAADAETAKEQAASQARAKALEAAEQKKTKGKAAAGPVTEKAAQAAQLAMLQARIASEIEAKQKLNLKVADGDWSQHVPPTTALTK